ncbi:hypothetical protein P775_03520 [Puniceibacterium antarcticum]|uniref:Uncharacterized protein n=1 Tax=Puniceibacterium antarcticum TaxID=1206336 RepID=A0A2G8RJ39_9RHOB|nr:hypothetical protein P775_03520 [Puniceibacterium antarcticum]
MDLAHGICDWDAKRGVAIQNRITDLEFCDLTVEVACHEALTQPFHAMHLRFGAASAMVSKRCRVMIWKPANCCCDTT